MPPAIIAGGIAAVGTIGGALLSSHAQTTAANQANAAQQQATQAQLQLGRESLGLNTSIYNSNYNTLSPFVSRGNVAGDSINALLGLPSAPAMTSPLASAPGTAGGGGADPSGYTGPDMATIMAMQHDGIPGNYQAALAAYTAAHSGQNALGQTPQMDKVATRGLVSRGIEDPSIPAIDRGGGSVAPATTSVPVPPGTPAPATGTPAPATGTPATGSAPVNALSAQDAFNNFANSAGMQFQMQQGADALNNRYAGHGLLQSGAAMKAMQGYGQQTALNNYFMPYMGLLSGQQSVGAGAGSAIAGVGANFGNTAAGINGQMGNALQGGADAAGNAALLRGQANSQMWGSVGGALGGLASSFFPRGY